MFEAEDRPALTPFHGPFDGFHEVDIATSRTCLVRYDDNRYSVGARTASRRVQLSAYAERNYLREREARVRFFNTVDPVNQLEADARAGKAGRLASQLSHADLVILDELDYLPFPREDRCCSTCSAGFTNAHR